MIYILFHCDYLEAILPNRMPRLKSNITVLIVLSTAQLFALTLWFSVNAIIPQLAAIWILSGPEISFLSIAVQLGFVVGAFTSSVFNLPDVFSTTKVFVLSAFLGGFANFLIIYAPSFIVIMGLRFLTGVFLAGVYPTGMKLMATWFQKGLGYAIGVLVAALTVGSGLPYLFNLSGIPDWKLILNFSTAFAFVSGVLGWVFIEEGPYGGKTAKFEFRQIKHVLQNKAMRLANFGYFGHMWELYAMWVWIPIFLRDVFQYTHPASDPTQFFSIGTFLVFFVGALATGIGGKFADKYGRTKFNLFMLFISGSCSVIIGFAFFATPYLALLIALIWGVAIIPDSPQYSAMITELSDPDYVGTALALQTAIGFLLTNVSIRLIPLIVERIGWRYGFTILVLGPIFGGIALFQLRQHNDSLKIAQGRK